MAGDRWRPLSQAQLAALAADLLALPKRDRLKRLRELHPTHAYDTVEQLGDYWLKTLPRQAASNKEASHGGIA